MTSITGADVEGSTQLTRRLSVLPTAFGIGSVVLLIATSALAGTLELTPWGTSLTWVAAASLGITIVSGHPVGLYIGMALLMAASLSGDEPMSLTAMIITVVGLLLVHETARPSLDARRPARFGPRLWLRFAIRTAAIAAVLGALALLAYRVRDLELAEWLVPTGLVVAALPLLGRRLVTGATDSDETWLPPTVVRVAFGVVVTATAVTGAILGAAARSGIENSRPSDSPTDIGSTPTTLPEVSRQLDDAAMVESGVVILLTLVTMLIAGLLYVALKRPEVAFDLDELDMTETDATFGLGNPGQADLDDQQIEIDDRQLADLLDELVLDIGAEEDPARAIRFGYANVERRLGEAGVTRSESETEQEFLVRALPSLGPHGRSLVDLTALFEHARFGHSAMTEDMRTAALEAVQALRGATTQEVESAPGEES